MSIPKLFGDYPSMRSLGLKTGHVETICLALRDVLSFWGVCGSGEFTAMEPVVVRNPRPVGSWSD